MFINKSLTKKGMWKEKVYINELRIVIKNSIGTKQKNEELKKVSIIRTGHLREYPLAES